MRIYGVVSTSQVVGPRSSQEDSILHLPYESKRHGKGHLLCVADGHDGAAVAKMVTFALPRIFDPEMPTMEEALATVVDRLDAQTMMADSGSTISLAAIAEDRGTATTAVLGDSPIYIRNARGVLHQSEMHNVSSQKELAAAIARGGVFHEEYLRLEEGGDGLLVTRALGNRRLRSILGHTPTITNYTLGFGSLVIVASDGIVGIAEPQHLIAKARKHNTAVSLLASIRTEALHDNTSIVMWRARPWWQQF